MESKNEIYSYGVVLLFLNACGSGGGDGTSVEQEPLKTLYFIDSPVNGIGYKCGVRDAKTQTQVIDNIEKHGVAFFLVGQALNMH